MHKCPKVCLKKFNNFFKFFLCRFSNKCFDYSVLKSRFFLKVRLGPLAHLIIQFHCKRLTETSLKQKNFQKEYVSLNFTKNLNQGDQRSVFPPCLDKLKYANQMGQYFVEKIRNIHSKSDNLAFTLPIDPHDSGADVQTAVAHDQLTVKLSEAYPSRLH